MSNNIEKLYELAKVKKVGKKLSCSLLDFGACKNINCTCCDKAQDKNYPPFTYTKQLKLIKWIEQTLDFVDVLQFVYKPEDNVWFLYAFVVEEFAGISTTPYTGMHTDFSQALAGLVCELWEYLTEVQREEVRGILQ